MEPTHEEILREAVNVRDQIITADDLLKDIFTVHVKVRDNHFYNVEFKKEGNIWDNGTILPSP